MPLVLEDLGRLCQQHKRVLLYLKKLKKKTHHRQREEYEEYGDTHVDISTYSLKILAGSASSTAASSTAAQRMLTDADVC
jgi:hypothetical protein